MPLPVKNTCTPSSTFGGFEHTLFLGCSVASFSINAGWNEQKSELTVQLVEDACPGNKVYYDRTLTKQTHTGVDPGFIGVQNNIIGVPVYFRVADFEFSGIIQDWVRSDIRSLNGSLPVKSLGANVNVYTVRISDPREILEATQVIVNEYAGFTTGLDNIINPYGFLEALADNCPPVIQGVDGTIFGAPAAGFGGADVDANGMPWNKVLAGSRVLLCGTSTYSLLGGVFSNGYLAFKGVSNTGYTGVTGITEGMGIIDQNASNRAHYVVDMSDLPTLPDFVRFNGVSFSLLDLISQVCEIGGYDYYVELLPVDTTGTSWSSPVIDGQDIAKIIKVRTVDRDLQPTFGAIEEFINITNNAGIGSKTNELGKEFRNELTNQLIVGGSKQNVFDTDNVDFNDPESDGDPANPEADDMIIPYFGLDANGNAIIPTKDVNGLWEFEADVRALNAQLGTYGFGLGVDSVTIHEYELLAALAGKEMWMYYSLDQKTDIFNALGNMGTMIDADLINKMAGQIGIAMRDLPKAGNNLNRFKVELEAKRLTAVQAVFDFVNNFATNFYGTKFQVRVPNTCAYIPTSQDGNFVGWGGKMVTSEEPSDGGWSEQTPLLGLTNPGTALDFFRLDDGRIQNFVRFPSLENQNISELNPEEFVGDPTSNTLWVKADAEDQFVFVDKATLFSPRIVLTISNPIDLIDDAGNPNPRIGGVPQLFNRLQKALLNIDNVEKALQGVGGKAGYFYYEYQKRIPDGAAVCIKSNALKYGPYGNSTVAGKATVKHEEGLVPWEYGSYANMDAAGEALAAEGITTMRVGERGSITVPGYPTLPIGAELLSASATNSYAGAGPFNGGGVNLFENRVITATVEGEGQFVSTSMPVWTGEFGPNITSVTTRVGTDGVETSYSMRTYTPKFGRFAKYNAERLKQIGQNNMKQAKSIRALREQQIRKNQVAKFNKNLSKLIKKATSGDEINKNTPHEFLVGSLNLWSSGDGDYYRPIISDNPLIDFGAETSNYGTKAFMSWDGLIMPISMDGYGGLPKFTAPLRILSSGHPKTSLPPIYRSSGEANSGQNQQYNLQIDIDYLNPFTNPSGYNRSDLSRYRSNTPEIGHHIEMLGRSGESGDVPPASSIVMPVQGFVDTDDQKQSDYQNDYGMFGIRGPIVMHGWGYDTDGFPIPNIVDTGLTPSGGSFSNENLEHKFLDNWLRKPHTWPVGPIDLRWDRNRSVWVSPPNYSLVKGRLLEDLVPSGSAIAELLTDTSLFDSTGVSFTGYFYAHDELYQSAYSGDLIIAEYDTSLNRYKIIHQPAGGQILVWSHNGVGAATASGSGTGISIVPGSSTLTGIIPISGGVGDEWVLGTRTYTILNFTQTAVESGRPIAVEEFANKRGFFGPIVVPCEWSA